MVGSTNCKSEAKFRYRFPPISSQIQWRKRSIQQTRLFDGAGRRRVSSIRVANSVNKAFVKRFQEKFGKDVPLANTVEANYDSVWLWKQAVEKAGKLDREAVMDALGGQTFLAPQGEITIDKKSNHTALHQIIAECQADGSFKIIKDFGKIDPVTECRI